MCVCVGGRGVSSPFLCESMCVLVGEGGMAGFTLLRKLGGGGSLPLSLCERSDLIFF